METRSKTRARRAFEEGRDLVGPSIEGTVAGTHSQESPEQGRQKKTATRTQTAARNNSAKKGKAAKRGSRGQSPPLPFEWTWMTGRKVTHEELIRAFDQCLPTPHVYPPLVEDQEVLSNSPTDNEDSDEEEDDPYKRFNVELGFLPKMTPDAVMAYANGQCDDPKVYLEKSIKKDLEEALQKMVNLKTKTKNPIEWLGYCLLNMNMAKEQDQPTVSKPQPKPSGKQLEFEIGLDVHAYESERIESGPLTLEFTNRARKRPFM